MMRTLDWVSPLRPAATDIAQYSLRVQQALSGRYEFNTIDNGASGDQAAYVLQNPPFFNIGNDRRFHGNILGACQASSGILIAHDYLIQDLIVGELQTRPGWEEHYVGLMARHYGPAGEDAALAFVRGRLPLADLAAQFCGLEIAAEKALCIITHNPALSDKLANGTGLYCATLPLPFPVPDKPAPAMPEENRARLNLLVFGYLGHNRGLEQLCELAARISSVQLNIAGSIGPKTLQAKVEQMKAAGCPIIDHGFLDEADLDKLIGAADLVVNLRHPSMGEVSGSQLRIFANHGLSVVCDTGWYAGLPDDAVFKINPQNMERELAGVLDQVSQDPAALHAMRLSGYRYVKANHSLEHFAAAFDTFMTSSHEALAHGRVLQLAKHMAALYEQAGVGRAVTGQALLERATHLLRAANP